MTNTFEIEARKILEPYLIELRVFGVKTPTNAPKYNMARDFAIMQVNAYIEVNEYYAALGESFMSSVAWDKVSYWKSIRDELNKI